MSWGNRRVCTCVYLTHHHHRFSPTNPPPKTKQITRFCLVCNYVTRIIEPLASRCAKFRFRPLSREAMQARLTHVAEAEGVRGAAW